MLLVKTYLGKSAIHGLGVFAGEFIRKGTKVWRFVEGFDRVYSPSEFARLPKPARDYIKNYGYRVDGEILLTIDHDHHMNHSEDANTHWHNGHIVARRNIRKGEEITNDYRQFDPAFCAAFLKNRLRVFKVARPLHPPAASARRSSAER
jgi:SET domain-containing protein